jgi:AcrR family transcriptional regulator
MSEAMRDRILDATARLLGRLGYEKMTMEDIAREAGIGKRTIYLHFPSKAEVALARIDRMVDRLEERLRAIALSDDTFTFRVRRMLVERVLYRFDSVRDYYQSLDDLFRSLRPAYLARRDRYFAREAAVFVEVLARGRAAGEFACDDLLTTANTLVLATNALLPSTMSAQELGRREEVEVQVNRIAELLLDGLRRRETPAPNRRSPSRRIKVQAPSTPA